MKHLFILLCILGFSSLSQTKETPLSQSESESESDSEENQQTNQCCSESGCCVSLTWSRSVSKKENVPPEFGGQYYCENMDITKSGCNEDDQLDYFLLPLSSPCDLTRAIWNLRWVTGQIDADGFIKAVVNDDDGSIEINNADEFLISASDIANNPTGFDALKVPVQPNPWARSTQTISVCSQLEWGDIVDTIKDEEIQIGFSLNDGDEVFSCSNATVRDICSIDISLAQSSSSSASTINLNAVNSKMNENDNVNDDWFNNFARLFEYYWNQWVGYGIAIFAASIFFNMTMCVYYSGYKQDTIYNDVDSKFSNKTFESDDETEEESEDLDETDSDNQEVIVNKI